MIVHAIRLFMAALRFAQGHDARSQERASTVLISATYGRGAGVGRALGVGVTLGVELGVRVGVAVGVGLAVGVGVGVLPPIGKTRT